MYKKELFDFGVKFLKAAGFAVTVADLLFAPSAAPAFAKLPSLATYIKNAPGIRIFYVAHFVSKPEYVKS